MKYYIMFFNQTLIDQYKNLFPHMDGYIYSYATLANHKKLKSIGLSMKTCCGTNIGKDYLDTSNRNLKKSFENNTYEYDFIGIFAIDITLLKSTNLEKNMMGFIIVQRGECIKFPDVYSINLICSPPSYRKGLILFGAYIYSLINNTSINDKRGVLELANSYFNPGGLCLYTKLGFTIQNDMYGSDCFYDYYNLPMILDIQSYGSTIDEQNDKLIRIINSEAGASFKKDPLCSQTDADIQKLSGLVLNLIIFVSNQMYDYIIDDKSAGDYDIHYNTLYNEIISNKRRKQSANQVISSNTGNQDLDKLQDFLASITTLSSDEISRILSISLRTVVQPVIPVQSVQPLQTTTRRSTRQTSTNQPSMSIPSITQKRKRI